MFHFVRLYKCCTALHKITVSFVTTELLRIKFFFIPRASSASIIFHFCFSLCPLIVWARLLFCIDHELTWLVRACMCNIANWTGFTIAQIAARTDIFLRILFLNWAYAILRCHCHINIWYGHTSAMWRGEAKARCIIRGICNWYSVCWTLHTKMAVAY